MPLCKVRRSAPALLLSAAIVVSAHAQDSNAAPSSSVARVDEILSTIHRARTIGQAAVSPDGKRVAWVLGGEILVAPIGDLAAGRRITAAAAPDERCTEGNLTWSPDSASLAFASDCAQTGEQSDLYLSHLDETAPTRLTRLRGDVDAPTFSPDGQRIAFLYVEGATRRPGALAAMNAPSGVIGEEGIEIQRVAAVPAGGSQPVAAEFATPANLHVYEFDWSPDSQSLAYIAADPPGENNWWVAKLYTQKLGASIPDFGTEDTSNSTPGAGSRAGSDAASGTVVLQLHSNPAVILDPSDVSGPLHGLQIAVPRWSPDGKTIAFIGGLMSDQGVTGGDVWVVPAEGGEPVDLTLNRPTSPLWIEWAGDQELFVAELAAGNMQLILLRLHASKGCTFGAGVHGPVFAIPARVTDGRGKISLSSGAGHNLFVFRVSSFDRPEEIYAARADSVVSACAGSEQGNLTQLSHFNDGIQPAWGQAISITWTNENFPIQGWLVFPGNYDPAKKYPLLVEVHGGPAAASVPHWDAGAPFSPAVFSALGYFVFLPNPRGSFGQGEAFTQANRKDFGHGDLRDILAGVYAVLARYSIDPHRIGLDGWSYGGFMTLFAVTQSHRFRAAVAGAGISDWLSYYGENSIGQWMIPYFGASVYDDPAVYTKSSPITFIKQVQTPTLMLVGDRDGECPAPQSFEFWHALHDLHVPARLVVYPNEGHGLTDPGHRRDVLERTAEWFATYLR